MSGSGYLAGSLVQAPDTTDTAIPSPGSPVDREIGSRTPMLEKDTLGTAEEIPREARLLAEPV